MHFMLRQLDTVVGKKDASEAGHSSNEQEAAGEMMDTGAAQETAGEMMDTSDAQETAGEMMDTSAAQKTTGEVGDTSAAQKTTSVEIVDIEMTMEVPSRKQEPMKSRGPKRPMAVGKRVIRRTGSYTAEGMTLTLHRPLSAFDRVTMQPLKERLPKKMPAFSKWLSGEKFVFTSENEKLAEGVREQSERYDANRLRKTIIDGRLRNAIIESQIAAGLRKAPQWKKRQA